MSKSSIWPTDRTLSGTTTPGQSGPGSVGNEGVLHIHQSSSITGALPLDFLVSYPRQSLEVSYPPAETQAVDSVVPADWAYNTAEVTKNICCVKGECAVDQNTVIKRFKKFFHGCKNL